MVTRWGSQNAAARALDIPRETLRSRLAAAQAKGITDAAPFDRPDLPSATSSPEELLARRRKDFNRVKAAAEARALVPVRINIDGPIGIVHFGDPHIDDPGSDIIALESHIDIIRKTPGLLGANVGDLQNNWIGRIAHLYSQQSTSAKEAWVLVEWMVKAIPWLYIVGGNHDAWSGSGDPLDWITRNQLGVFENWGARLGLTFPNGKNIRINARHDFAGHSMWNTAHGPAKAVQMGWRDHILTCGHTHTSGYQVLKDPASGLVSHVLRVAGYKVFDRYASEKGLPNQNITPASVTVIDPRWPDDDPRLITVLHDVETAADFLTFLRKRK